MSLETPQRQSPLAMVFLALRTVRQIGIVQLIIGAGFVFSRSPSLIFVIVGVLIIAAVFFAIAALRWWRYTFVVRDGELQVSRGVLSRDTLTVPLDRIQSVSVDQKFLHRIVKLVQVSLDTAGTDSTEFTIDAIDRDVATELQRVAADYRPQAVAADPPPPGAAARVDGAEGFYGFEGVGGLEVTPQAQVAPPFEEVELLRHNPSRLLAIGFTRVPFSGLAVLAPLIALSGELVDFVPEDIVDMFDVDDQDIGFSLLVWLVPVALIAIVLFGILLNLVRSIFVDWNLRITRTESGLRRDAGLMSTTSRASSIKRVQRVEVRQGVLQRIVGLYDVTLHNIGEGDFPIPGCDSDQVELIRNLALDGSAGVGEMSRRTSTAEVFRNTRNMLVLMVIVGVVTAIWLGFWSVLFVLPILWAWFGTTRRVKLRRWGIDADSIAKHDEFLGSRYNEALLRKLNGVTIRQSRFERKRGLATVTVRLAGGILQGGLSIGLIPIEEAKAIRDHVLYVAETDRQVFM